MISIAPCDLRSLEAPPSDAERQAIDALLGAEPAAAQGSWSSAKARRHLLLPALHAAQGRVGFISPGGPWLHLPTPRGSTGRGLWRREFLRALRPQRAPAGGVACVRRHRLQGCRRRTGDRRPVAGSRRGRRPAGRSRLAPQSVSRPVRAGPRGAVCSRWRSAGRRRHRSADARARPRGPRAWTARSGEPARAAAGGGAGPEAARACGPDRSLEPRRLPRCRWLSRAPTRHRDWPGRGAA